jgi:hypothetical protein
MKNKILYAMISMSVLACFPGEGISQTDQLTYESGANVNPATPDIRFSTPDPNQAEIEEQKVKDYRAQQAALRISP